MQQFLLGMQFVYYNYFLSLLVPFFHFLLLVIILKAISVLRREILSSADLKSAVLFLFTYFQPEFVY